MRDKLYLLDNLSFAQIACAMLGVDSRDDNPTVFDSYIKQLFAAAAGGKIEGAKKELKIRPQPLLFTALVGSGASTEAQDKKKREIEANEAYINNPNNWEYSSCSEVPRKNIISYLKAEGQSVPACIATGKEESLDLNNKAQVIAYLLIKTAKYFYGNGQTTQEPVEKVQNFIKDEIKNLGITYLEQSDIQYIQRQSTPHEVKNKGNTPKN